MKSVVIVRIVIYYSLTAMLNDVSWFLNIIKMKVIPMTTCI